MPASDKQPPNELVPWLTQGHNQSRKDIDRLIQDPLVTQWIEPELLNGWAAPASPMAAVQYRYHMKTNALEFRGHLSGGVSGTIAFNIIPPFRPLYDMDSINTLANGEPVNYRVSSETGDVTVSQFTSGNPVAMWPTQINLMNPQVITYDLYYHSYSTYLVAGSPASPFGSYSQNMGNDEIDATDFYMRLGPKGSVWVPVWHHMKGPDCGKFKLGIQAIDENSHAPIEWPSDFSSEESLIDTYDDTAPYYPGNSWGWEWDLYAATNYWGTGEGNSIRIMGEDGVFPITNVVNDGPAKALDSGSGIYRLRITPNGKNASSSGYRKRFGAFHMLRLTGFSNPISG